MNDMIDHGCGHFSHMILGGPCRQCGMRHPGQTCAEFQDQTDKQINRIVKKLLSKETPMTVRAKLKLSSIKTAQWFKGHEGQKTLHFDCQYDQSIPEDQRFQKATPSGSIELQIDNPVALEQFEIGKTYYVDFTPAE